jgi:hypothetical protein
MNIYDVFSPRIDTVVQLINERVHGLMRESDVILQTEASVRGMMSSFETAQRSARQAQLGLSVEASGAPVVSRSSAEVEFIKDALERYSVICNGHSYSI